MKTSKILAGFLFAGAAFAYACGGNGGACASKKGDCGDKKCDMKMPPKPCDIKNTKGCDSGSKCSSKHDMKFFKSFIESVEILTLSKEQEAKIEKILSESKPPKADLLEAFKADKFDATAYVNMVQNEKLEHTKHQAELIGKIFDVLTPAQKTELKNDMLEFAKEQRGKCDKSPACRR